MDTKVYIKGAISTNVADEGFIIAGPSVKSDHHLKFINSIDQDLRNYFDSYSDVRDKLELILYFSDVFNADHEIIVVRAVKNFTVFERKNRSYHRREYYFFSDLAWPPDPRALYKLLPPLQQFDDYIVDYLPVFSPVDKNKIAPSPHLLSSILDNAVNKTQRTLIIRTHQESDNLFSALGSLPSVYLGCLSFGLNVPSSAPGLFKKVDIIGDNTLNAPFLEDLKENLAESEVFEIAQDIIARKSNYDDVEIKELGISDNRLSALAKFHYINYYLNKESYPRSAIQKDKFIMLLREYFADFFKLSFSGHMTLHDRVLQAWKLLYLENSNTGYQDFEPFWKLVFESKIDITKVSYSFAGFWTFQQKLIDAFPGESHLISVEEKFPGFANLSFADKKITIAQKLQLARFYKKSAPTMMDFESANHLSILAGEKFDKRLALDKVGTTIFNSAEGTDELIKRILFFNEQLSLEDCKKILEREEGDNMFRYASSGKEFFASKKLVQSCLRFLQAGDAKNPAAFNKAIRWIELYLKNSQPISPEETGIVKYLENPDRHLDTNSFLEGLDAVKKLYKEFDTKAIFKKFVQNISPAHLTESVADRMIDQSIKLDLSEEYLNSLPLDEYQALYYIRKNFPDVLKSGDAKRIKQKLLEYHSETINNNPELLLSVLQFNKKQARDFLKVIEKSISMEEKNTTGEASPDPRSKKKGEDKKSKILSQLIMLILMLAVGYSFLIYRDTNEKLIKSEEVIQRLRSDSMAIHKKQLEKPVTIIPEKIYVRQRAKDSLKTFIIYNKDSLVYLPASKK